MSSTVCPQPRRRTDSIGHTAKDIRQITDGRGQMHTPERPVGQTTETESRGQTAASILCRLSSIVCPLLYSAVCHLPSICTEGRGRKTLFLYVFCRPSSSVCPLPSVLCRLSSAVCPLRPLPYVLCRMSSSTVLYRMTIDICPLPSVPCRQFSVLCRLSSAVCLLPSVFCRLSSAVCLLPSVSCRQFSAVCPLLYVPKGREIIDGKEKEAKADGRGQTTDHRQQMDCR